ncbi:MAG: phosphopantothenoylcysteine decarboxylase [Leptospiraceae bacterium]|nr:phosphopantothenoylcysteine decarboxylase [Leptospiraceae bacterium]MCP5498407.1 phosphopantothenoylcysteine decarboxylase [Leptospiraceae bacterium]
MRFKKAIITAGPTREWIDPVRFLSNASSGKMGFCIASEIAHWVEHTVYIHGAVEEKFQNPVVSKKIFAESTLSMQSAIFSELEDSCLIIMAAAPADFRPLGVSENKIKKSGKENIEIHLCSNPDILMSLSEEIQKRSLKDVVKIGFAAETENLEENAIGKLRRKGLQFIIGNYVSRREKGFGDIDTSITIFSNEGSVLTISSSSKEDVAREISLFLKERFQ